MPYSQTSSSDSQKKNILRPIHKRAVICGRLKYKSPWRGKYVDIVPAYENMQSMIKFFRKAGFKEDEIIIIEDPTKEKIDKVFKDLMHYNLQLKKDGCTDASFIGFYFAGHSVVNKHGQT